MDNQVSYLIVGKHGKYGKQDEVVGPIPTSKIEMIEMLK